MLFRLGGPFVLCFFAAYAARNVWPLTFEAGVATTLVVYILVALLVARAYRRFGRSGPRSAALPSWPMQEPGFLSITVAFFVVEAALGVALYVARPGPDSMLASAFVSMFGAYVMVLSAYAVKFGYFPSGDPEYGRGVSRSEDPPQFWAIVTVGALFGLALVFFGVRRLVSLIE